MNLFTPSSARWTAGSGRYGLTQQTKYPFDSKIQIRVSASQPTDYTLYIRIPAWATPDPVLTVNDRRVSERVEPGTFVALKRTWKEGDQVGLELPVPLRLEAVDAEHPTQVALVRGLLVLFAIADSQPSFDKAELLRAAPAGNAAGDSVATSGDGKLITMRPFMSIDRESYSTYVELKA